MPTLDAVRAIAVSLVVLSHLALQFMGGVDHSAYSFRTMGHVGVAIFFVHTTLVLMASLDRHGPAAIPFYVRRFFRIYPLSVTIVLLLALLSEMAGSPVETSKILSNLFLVQNLTGHDSMPHPLWSLPYEVQMYLVLPALYWITRTSRPAIWISLLCAGSVIFLLTLQPNSYGFKLLRFVPCFLPGLLAFALARQTIPRANPLILFGLIGALGIVGIPMLVAAGMREIPLLWCLCLTLGVSIPACRPIQDGLVASGSKLIAKYSYGIYLTHVFALATIDGRTPGPSAVQWVAIMILLPGLAYVFYHGVEKHGIALGARLAERCASNGKLDQRNSLPG